MSGDIQVDRAGTWNDLADKQSVDTTRLPVRLQLSAEGPGGVVAIRLDLPGQTVLAFVPVKEFLEATDLVRIISNIDKSTELVGIVSNSKLQQQETP